MISDYVVRMIVQMIHAEIRMIHRGNIVRKYAGTEDQQDPFFTDPGFLGDVWERPALSVPDIFSENASIYYARLDMDRENALLAGPVRVTGSMTDAEQWLLKTHGLTDTVRIPSCDMLTFLNGILLLYHEATGREISTQDLYICHGPSAREQELSSSEFHRTLFQKREDQRLHNPYQHEQRKLQSIQEGKMAELAACQREVWTGELGRVAENPLRQEKNISIIVIVLASRAAIRGGLSAEFAFSLADHDIIQIERMNDIMTIRAATLQYEMEFARLVSRQLNTGNLYVKKAGEYIYLHLHEPIRVSDIAAFLKVHPDHLTRVFRREKGLSVQEYIQTEKMKEAKRLLDYSNYSISEIAAFLAFGSQSSFSKCFRKTYGETPAAWRKNTKTERS